MIITRVALPPEAVEQLLEQLNATFWKYSQFYVLEQKTPITITETDIQVENVQLVTIASQKAFIMAYPQVKQFIEGFELGYLAAKRREE